MRCALILRRALLLFLPAASLLMTVAILGQEPAKASGQRAGGALGFGREGVPDTRAISGCSRKDYLAVCADPAFRNAVQKKVDRLDFPYPAEEAEWREKLAPFVPCILDAFGSREGCIHSAALDLLIESRDPRAVKALVDTLKKRNDFSPESQRIREALARDFRSPEGVPYICAILNTRPALHEQLGVEAQTAGFMAKDPRVFEALMGLFREWIPSPAVTIVVQSLRYGHCGSKCRPAFLEVFRALARVTGDTYIREYVGADILDAETFEEVGEFYLEKAARKGEDCTTLGAALIAFGGPRYEALLRKGFAQATKPVVKERFAMLLVAALTKRIPKDLPPGQTGLGWFRQEAGEVLDQVKGQTLLTALEHCPEGKPTAPAAGRADFWIGVSDTFSLDSGMEARVWRNIAEAYGPQGTDEPEKQLAAVRRAIQASIAYQMKVDPRYAKEGPNDLVGMERELTGRLALEKTAAGVSIVLAGPVRPGDFTGVWRVEVRAPKGLPLDPRLASPSAMVDVETVDGGATSLSAGVEPQNGVESDDKYILKIQPDQLHGEKPPGIRARVRLIFPPGDGVFSGVLISDWVSRSQKRG